MSLFPPATKSFYNPIFLYLFVECCGVVLSGLVCLLLNKVIAQATDSSHGMEKYDLKMFINFYIFVFRLNHTHEWHTHKYTKCGNQQASTVSFLLLWQYERKKINSTQHQHFMNYMLSCWCCNKSSFSNRFTQIECFEWMKERRKYQRFIWKISWEMIISEGN